MTPEQYVQAKRKLQRYGHSFDIGVNSKLPQPLLKTKAGKIAKRQPGYDKRPKAYYQAQCSFRGLQTSGSIEELQQALQGRDGAKELAIREELEQVRNNAEAYEDEQERLHRAQEEAQERVRFEQWWQNPTTTFEDKLLYHPQEALQEDLGKPDTLLSKACRIFNGYQYDLAKPARILGLAYVLAQGPSELPPGSDIQQCQIIGEATAVQAQARKFTEAAANNAKEAWHSYKAKVEARKAAQQARRQAFIAEASLSEDWDITGRWNVLCNELATYQSIDRPERLGMTIYKDDYHLDAVCEDDPLSDDEYETDLEDERRAREKQAKMDSPSDQQRPRFCAKFNFGIVEGIMRIYPPSSARQTPNWTGIQQSPTFQYRWRGEETGEGEIQLEALNFVRDITFSEHGTKFEALFDCPFIGGPLRIIGVQESHGRGQKLSSAYEWSHLNENAYNRGSNRRWGGW